MEAVVVFVSYSSTERNGHVCMSIFLLYREQ